MRIIQAEQEPGIELHQASSLSPYLFDLVMDVIPDGLRNEASR